MPGNAFDKDGLGEALVRNGFVFVPRLVSGSTVSDMRLAIRSEISSERDVWHSDLETVVPNIVEKSDLFREVATNSKILEILSVAMGPDIHLVMSHGHFKKSHTKSHTVPHSDIGHLRGVDHSSSFLMAKCMIALSDISADGGGVAIFEQTFSSISTGYPSVALGTGKCFPMKAGDAIFFNAAMMHSATDNKSEDNRISLWLAYAHSWMRQLPGFETTSAFREKIEKNGNQKERQIFGLNEPYCDGAAVAIPLIDCDT